MNISKLIAKFILASFVFSSTQGPVLALGENDKQHLRNLRVIDGINKANKELKAFQAPNTSKTQAPVTQNQDTTPVTPVTTQDVTTTPEDTKVPGEVVEETKSLFARLCAALPAMPKLSDLPSKADLYAKIPSKNDILAMIPSKDGVSNGLYNGYIVTKDGVIATKDGALNIVAKVTPQCILNTKYGIEAVTFVIVGGTVAGTVYAIYHFGVKKGGFAKVKTTLGSVKDFVASYPKTLKTSLLAGLAALAYKTDVKTAGYVLAGASALYAAGKLAGYAKNAAKSEQVSKVTGYLAKPFVAAKDAAVSATKAVGSGLNSVKTVIGSGLKTATYGARKAASYVPVIGKYVAPAQKPVQEQPVQKPTQQVVDKQEVFKALQIVAKNKNNNWRSLFIQKALSNLNDNELKQLVTTLYANVTQYNNASFDGQKKGRQNDINSTLTKIKTKLDIN